jgi:hypothetical protein
MSSPDTVRREISAKENVMRKWGKTAENFALKIFWEDDVANDCAVHLITWTKPQMNGLLSITRSTIRFLSSAFALTDLKADVLSLAVAVKPQHQVRGAFGFFLQMLRYLTKRQTSKHTAT